MACPILHSGGIYVIRHIASSKVYVGSAAKVAQRWRVHRHNLKKRGHHSVLLQRAWHKYGPDAFSWEVVEPVFIASELAAREQFWMDTLSACDPSKGYNIFPKARSSIGRKLTPEQCKAMSIARLGKPLGPPSEEHRRNLSKARLSKGIGKGVPLRTEHKAKLKGLPRSAEAIANHAAAAARRVGKPLSPSHAANVRAALLIRNRSPEMRAAGVENNRRRRAEKNKKLGQTELF